MEVTFQALLRFGVIIINTKIIIRRRGSSNASWVKVAGSFSPLLTNLSQFQPHWPSRGETNLLQR